MDNKTLFWKLFFAKTENEVEHEILAHEDIFANNNWKALGGQESYFGIIENQQASPIPALIEKITNSIDAILTKKCLEAGIEPSSAEAPKSMDEAIAKFFPDHKLWDTTSIRKKQAESIQIIADGPKMNTSLIIYDDGEGQHPEMFEETFLSLLRGNKNKIHFVQGKYNMGGSGAIVFCGKKRYHLIASKRFDNTGNFGFTLIRKHPFTGNEKISHKNTWYEYLLIDGKIPSFPITTLDLNLYKRKFTTGTILKLYSYDLPAGTRSVISRDLNLSINEYLFEPALPVYIIDTKERYPDDINLERDMYGLKRRLEESKNKYVDRHFIEEYKDRDLGTIKVTCYVFKTKIEKKNSKESRETIRREFFKNGNSVMFSVNGQVHGTFTAEFISRTLKMQLIKDYLLIHVDCTGMDVELRNELFMASRDRLKQGEVTSTLRETVGKILLKSPLAEIYKQRKDTISFAGEDKNEILKSFTKNLPLKSDLLKLLQNTFKLEEKQKPVEKPTKTTREKHEEEPFNPKRFPSYFKFGKDKTDSKPMIKVPLGSERTIRFNTDVENEYFVRVEEPGELKIGVLGANNNESSGGNKPGTPKKIEDIFYVQKSGPENGTIKLVFTPTEDVQVGDSIEVKTTLTSPGSDFDQIFYIKVVEKEKEKEPSKIKVEEEDDQIGLPELCLVYKHKNEDEEKAVWQDMEQIGTVFNHETVMHPLAEGDILQSIYINMDSSVMKNYKSALKSAEQIATAEKRYYSSVYFHTLFLYTISKNRKYSFTQTENETESPKDIGDYIKDIFDSYYAQFLLNFEMSALMQSLEG